MNIAHALERLMLSKLAQDYCNKHGVEYSPNIQTKFQRIAKHIQEHIDEDARALCERCKTCDDDSCTLS